MKFCFRRSNLLAIVGLFTLIAFPLAASSETYNDGVGKKMGEVWKRPTAGTGRVKVYLKLNDKNAPTGCLMKSEPVNKAAEDSVRQALPSSYPLIAAVKPTQKHVWMVFWWDAKTSNFSVSGPYYDKQQPMFVDELQAKRAAK